jgi:hypothetical protein
MVGSHDRRDVPGGGKETMSDVTLNIIRNEAFTVETTESDIRAACDKHGIPCGGLNLAELLDRVQRGGYSGELVLASLAVNAELDSEEWELDDWDDNTDDEEITTELPAWR